MRRLLLALVAAAIVFAASSGTAGAAVNCACSAPHR